LVFIDLRFQQIVYNAYICNLLQQDVFYFFILFLNNNTKDSVINIKINFLHIQIRKLIWGGKMDQKETMLNCNIMELMVRI
jgi:hypothetical protein